MVRQAQDAGQPGQPSFRRKPESRKSYRERASRLPRILDSGESRNDGGMMRLPWLTMSGWVACWYVAPLILSLSKDGVGGSTSSP